MPIKASKSLEILCKAVLEHFPWGAEYGKAKSAWASVCEDYSKAMDGKSITAQTAKNKIEDLMKEWGKYKGEDHYSGVLVNELDLQKYLEDLVYRK
jgi:hypothetical protein